MRHTLYADTPYDENEPIFLDTETCGFVGFPVMIQFAIGREGKVVLHDIPSAPIFVTVQLIEDLINHKGGHCGFNYTFDMYHLIKCYNVLLQHDDDWESFEDLPPELVEKYEVEACKEPIALKPHKICDLMLHARSTALQICMNRSNVPVRRVPTELAELVARELNDNIYLPGILFSKKKRNPNQRFEVVKITHDDGTVDEDFQDVMLRFAPSTQLKSICKYLKLTKEDRLLFEDVHIAKEYFPDEYEFAPLAITIKDKYRRWTRLYKYHAEHWLGTEPRLYAEDDIHDTRALYYYFREHPEKHGVPDWDSVDNSLVSLVSNTRYKGFRVDVGMIKALRVKAQKIVDESPYNFGSPDVCKKYLTGDLEPEILMILTDPQTGKLSTRGENLEEIAKLYLPGDVCDDCFGEGCNNCDDGLMLIYETVEIDGELHKVPKKHPAAIKARQILDFRHMKKEIELYDKTLIYGRIFPDVKILGAKSSRMSGSGGFNFQGVKSAKYVRDCFKLKNKDEFLGIGDLDAFEISIMEAVYADPVLREDLLSGKKIHALFAQALFPEKSYDDIMKTKDLPSELNLYGKGKGCLFCMLYGGSENKIAETASIPLEQAREAFTNFGSRYQKWQEVFNQTIREFSALVQQGSIGSKIVWQDPLEYAETLFGFKRYFDIDYQICKVLFDLANHPPTEWKEYRTKVQRKDRVQTQVSAAKSSLFAAAFGIASAVVRQAQNHRIQGSGAYVTKVIQKGVWSFQPVGVHRLIIRAIQIHDEVIACGDKDLEQKVADRIQEDVNSFKEIIPLIAMSWANDADSWAESH